MKKRIAAGILALTMIFSAAGCNSSDNKDEKASEKENTNSTAVSAKDGVEIETQEPSSAANVEGMTEDESAEDQENELYKYYEDLNAELENSGKQHFAMTDHDRGMLYADGYYEDNTVSIVTYDNGKIFWLSDIKKDSNDIRTATINIYDTATKEKTQFDIILSETEKNGDGVFSTYKYIYRMFVCNDKFYLTRKNTKDRSATAEVYDLSGKLMYSFDVPLYDNINNDLSIDNKGNVYVLDNSNAYAPADSTTLSNTIMKIYLPETDTIEEVDFSSLLSEDAPYYDILTAYDGEVWLAIGDTLENDLKKICKYDTATKEFTESNITVKDDMRMSYYGSIFNQSYYNFGKYAFFGGFANEEVVAKLKEENNYSENATTTTIVAGSEEAEVSQMYENMFLYDLEKEEYVDVCVTSSFNHKAIYQPGSTSGNMSIQYGYAGGDSTIKYDAETGQLSRVKFPSDAGYYDEDEEELLGVEDTNLYMTEGSVRISKNQEDNYKSILMIDSGNYAYVDSTGIYLRKYENGNDTGKQEIICEFE